ncbi:MAG: cysteine desulfurase family protein [Mycobacteriales bacterium]
MTLEIYLDYAASTPIDPRVVAAMSPYHGAANPSSSHGPGRGAAAAVERARQDVATLIGAAPTEIVFTSGATEADNLAIGGVVQAAGLGHVVTSTAEHKAVLQSVTGRCPDATILPVQRDGSVDPESVRAALRADTVLVSIMAANNEVGTRSRVHDIGKICRERDVLFHTDAAQLVGKLPFDVSAAPVDLMSISAHKMYGPMGVGALWVRRSIQHRVTAQMLGGGHERGLRSGTTNVAGCVGFGEAARIAGVEGSADEALSRGLRRRLIERLAETFDGAEVNGSLEDCVPGILNVHLPAIDAESLLLATPRVAASTGSACTSAVPAASHVLLAMGVGHIAARQSVRLSFGRFSTPGEVDAAVEAFAASAEMVRDVAEVHA